MRSLRPFIFILCGLLLAGIGFASDKQAGSQQSTNVRFTVLKDDNNKPVRNASVILHPVGKDGKQSKGGFQLKTANDGKTASEGLPYGLLRIQVLAPGFQTFGEDYDLNKPEMDIEIRLKRPKEQMSVYDKPPAKSETPPAPPPAEPKPQ
jgi:hypothetical protein